LDTYLQLMSLYGSHVIEYIFTLVDIK
jgi:hypothetical protein